MQNGYWHMGTIMSIVSLLCLIITWPAWGGIFIKPTPYAVRHCLCGGRSSVRVTLLPSISPPDAPTPTPPISLTTAQTTCTKQNRPHAD
jgi:hypothetical protein